MKNYNFGKRGWITLALCFILYLLSVACSTDGENIILPKMAAANGWDYTSVLNLATVAGCCSVVGSLALGRLCNKKGPKFTILAGLICSAVFMYLYSTATSIIVYVIGLFGAICSSQAMAYIGAAALIANWFPKKKGLAMGIVTVGPPVSTICMVSVMNALMKSLGLRTGVMIICGIVLAVAVLCFFLLKDTPEECGCTPDNLPVEKDSAPEAEQAEETEKLPVSALFRMKEFWFLLIMMGIANLSITGLMSQFLTRCTDSGISDATAALYMSAMAVIGMFGSMIAGNVEQRIGTKKAFVIFGSLWALGFVLNFTNNPVLMIISLPLFGCNITFLQIFLPLLEIGVFGRKHFAQANSILFPLISMIGQITFVLISVCISIFGEVRYAYLLFAALLAVSVFLCTRLKLKDPA